MTALTAERALEAIKVLERKEYLHLRELDDAAPRLRREGRSEKSIENHFKHDAFTALTRIANVVLAWEKGWDFE